MYTPRIQKLFYPIYYVILTYLLLVTFHGVQIIHFKHSIFYFIMHILACECLQNLSPILFL